MQHKISKKVLSLVIVISMLFSFCGVIPAGAAIDNSSETNAEKRGNLSMAYLGDGTAPTTSAQAMPNTAGWTAGKEFWVGVYVSDLKKMSDANAADATNDGAFTAGTIQSFFNLDDAKKPGTTTNMTAGIETLCAGITYSSTYLEPVIFEWSEDDYEDESSAMGGILFEHLSGFQFWDGLGANYKVAGINMNDTPLSHSSVDASGVDNADAPKAFYMNLESTSATKRVLRSKDTLTNDPLFLFVAKFKLKQTVPGDKIVLSAIRNASQLSIGTGTNSERWASQWNTQRNVTPDTNLKNFLDYTGDLNLFPAGQTAPTPTPAPKTTITSATATAKTYTGSNITATANDFVIKAGTTTLTPTTDYTIKTAPTGDVKNVGQYTYKIALTTEAAKKYQFTAAGASEYDIKLTVNPASLTVGLTAAKTKDYGQALTLAATDFTVTGLLGSDTAAALFSSWGITSDGLAANKDAGEYSIKFASGNATSQTKGNYAITLTTTNKVKVNKLDTKAVFTPATGLKFKNAAFADNELGTVKVVLASNNTDVASSNYSNATWTYTKTPATVKDVGTYSVVVSSNAWTSKNYNKPTSADAKDVNVAKADSAISVPTNASVMKGKTLDLATLVKVTGVGNVAVSDFTLSYAIEGDAKGSTISGSTLTAGNDGPVTVKVTAAGNSTNYNAPTAKTFNVAISDKNQIEGNLTITATPADVTEGETEKVTLNVTGTTTPAGTKTYKWYKGETELSNTTDTYEIVNPTAADAGEYKCVVVVNAGADYDEKTYELTYTLTVGAAATPTPTATPTATPEPTATPTATPKPTQRPSTGGGSSGGSSLSIKFKNSTETGYVGETLKLEPTVKGSTKTPTWTSADKTIATVDENGVVTMLKEGTVKITAKIGSTIGTVTVKVLPVKATPTPTVAPTEKPVINDQYTKPYASGYEDGNFLPEDYITRGELASMIARLSYGDDIPNGMYVASFSDVPADAWANKYIGYLEGLNVLSGYEDGTFRPYNTITRGEICAVIARAQKYSLISADMFSDVTSADWAKDYISTLASKNIVSGYEDGTFGPYSSLTRAEAVAMINRVLAPSTPIITFTPLDIAGHWAQADVLLAVNERKVNGSNVTEPKVTATPEVTAEPEATADPKATANPEATTDPKATANPEATTDPKATEAPAK